MSRKGIWVEQEEMRRHGGCLENMYACVAHGGMRNQDNAPEVILALMRRQDTRWADTG